MIFVMQLMLRKFSANLAGAAGDVRVGYKTIEWYPNENWWQAVLDGSYRGQRLGLG